VSPHDKSRRAAAFGLNRARSPWERRREKAAQAIGKVAAFTLKLPIHAYRYRLSMLIGRRCRHLPTCSEYAIAAIDLNGPWRGFWLALSRFSRCRPGGTSGFDPAPDIRAERHPLTPWRYGRWRATDTAEEQQG
jgi:uncharacterized protein